MNLNILTFLVLVIFSRCEQWYEAGNPHFLDQSNVLPAMQDTQSIKVLKFFSPWCKYCRYIKNYVDNYKSSHTISPNLKFYEFNCQGNAGLFCFTQFQVRAYPAVIIIDEKGERVSRIDGLYPQDTINSILDQFNNRANTITPHPQQKQQEQTKKQPAQPEKVESQQVKKQEIPKKAESQAQNKEQKKQVKQQQQKDRKKQQVKQQKKEQKQEQSETKKEQVKKEQQTAEVKKQQVKKQQQAASVKKQQVKQKKEEAHKQQQKVTQAVEEKEKQGQSKLKRKGNIEQELPKIQKQMVNEESVDKEAKVDPSNIEAESKFVEQQTTENGSFQFFKYLFYIVGISVGVLYGIKIFSSKKQTNVQVLASKNIASQVIRPKDATNDKRVNRASSKDMQKQILVEQVMDQNL